jgi:hypothetical protein
MLLSDDLGSPLLVLGVDMREEEADRDRLDAEVEQSSRRRAHLVLVERDDHSSGVIDSLADAEPALAAADRHGRRVGEIEQVLAVAAPQLDHVAEALRADEAGEAAGVFEHRVRRHRRAQHDHVGVA